MSSPITGCMIIKAAINEDDYFCLLETMKFNYKFGSHIKIPCNCTPPCKEKYNVTDEMIDNLNKKFAKDWNEYMNNINTVDD